MRRALLVLVLVTASALAAPRSDSFKRGMTVAPTLTVNDEQGRSALTLAGIAVHTIVRGHLARTIFELTYRNDLDRVVSGDFVFPLPADAEVSDLGLYFNGRLRHGVAVERVQARTAYEQIIHRRRDPALAEWSAGRAFRFSIFPIDPHGTKSVRIAYDQELTAQPYLLDLRWGTTVERLDVLVDAETQRVDTSGLDLHRENMTWHAHAANVTLDATVGVTRNSADETALTAWSPEDSRWYASAPVRVGGDAELVADASRLVLLWDVSGSAARRDDQRVLEFLRALGTHINKVTLVPFHLNVEPARDVEPVALEQAIADLPAAGATNLASVLGGLPSLAAQFAADTRIMLVTDGVSSIDADAQAARAAAALGAIRRPILVVNAFPSPNDQLLGAIARATGGWYLDLTRMEPAAAAESARHVPARRAIESAWHSVEDVLPSAIVTSGEETIGFSASSRDPIGVLPIRIGERRRFIPAREIVLPADGGDLVRRAWARVRLRELLDSGAADAVVLEHGRRFNQLTPRTSLLVLESFRDYEFYGIPMPPDVRAEKEASERALSMSMETASRPWKPSTIEARGRSNERPPEGAAWFITGTIRSSDDSELPGATVTIAADQETRSTITENHGRYWLTLNRQPARFTLDVAMDGFGTVRRLFSDGTASGSIIDAWLNPAVYESITVTAYAPKLVNTTAVAASLGSSRIAPTREALADRLLATFANREPEAFADENVAAEAAAKRHATIEQVVAKLRAFSSPSDQLRYYVAARSVLGGDKWFHAHAALAIHDSDAALATRLLTDLVEAYPDDAPLLRIVGRILDGWGQPALARMLFARALVLAPRETQTWRELLLLESRIGDANGVAELRHRYETADRDTRFNQVDDQLKSELPRLGSSGIDARRDPASALHIDAMWDSDYSDVDIHVTEPGGEEVMYSHRTSANGGRLHDDVIVGYGPETYTIAHVAAGDYKIELDYYAADAVAVGAETLIHVIIYDHGLRRDEVVVLGGQKERVPVATVRY
jgi:hypothetical protein